jgi:Flp pilus assembly protein TadD
MRVNRWRRNERSKAGRFALVVLGACIVAAGCQEAQFDHVDGSSAAFNASRIPTVERQQSVAGAGSQKETAPAVTSEAAGSTTQSPVANNDAVVVENLNLGHREAALNRLEQAESYYRRVLEIQPENSVANHRLAVIADKKHDFARAEHYYLTALRHDSRNPDLLGDLGYSYLLQGRREESERYLLAATRIDPSHAKSLHNLSLLYAMSGDYDRSFDALRRAVGESEAQVKIARLFPNGRPPASGGDEMVASFQPSESNDGSSPAAVERSADAAPMNGLRPADAAPTSGLQPSAPLSATPLSATEPVATFGSFDAPAVTPRPAEVASRSAGHVPDSQINDVFAAIDREEATHDSQPAPSAPQLPPQVDVPPPASMPQTAVAPRGTGASGLEASDLQAAPGTNPLTSMPLWPPAASASPQQKPPAEFLFDEDSASAPQHPHAIPTGIVPTSANAEAPRTADKGDTLSEYVAELQKNKNTVSAGRTQSNAGPTRDPLIAERPAGGTNSSADQRGKADDASWPAPFESAPPLHIQPRGTPAPLFEPVEGFGPANDFAPGDDTSVPAWPSTNGSPAAPSGDAADAGPAIHPRSSN